MKFKDLRRIVHEIEKEFIEDEYTFGLTKKELDKRDVYFSLDVSTGEKDRYRRALSKQNGFHEWTTARGDKDIILCVEAEIVEC